MSKKLDQSGGEEELEYRIQAQINSSKVRELPMNSVFLISSKTTSIHVLNLLTVFPTV